MAKPPILGQLRVDLLKDVPEEISPVLQQVFYALNPFLQNTKDALAGKLGWDNFRAVRKVVDVSSLPLVVTIPEIKTGAYWVNVVQAFDTSSKTEASVIPPRVAWTNTSVRGVPAVSITAASDYDSAKTYRWSLLITG